MAKRTGAKLQKGSGSGWLHDNDSKTDSHLQESKVAVKVHALKADYWEEFRANALRTGRQPIYYLKLGKRHLVIHEEGVDCGE